MVVFQSLDGLGLIYLRVPTWSLFRLQFYCNGHSWLARKLTAQGIGYTMADNAFVRIVPGHVPRNWRISSRPTNCIARWTATPRSAARCPMHSDSPTIGARCRWNTPPTWRSDPPTTLGPLYGQLIRETVLSVKAEQVASFLGRQITPLLAQEIGSQPSTGIEGTCVKHRFGKCSIKMYDKCGVVLRIETTTNDVSTFKHHRRWNIATARRAGKSPRSRRPSTA